MSIVIWSSGYQTTISATTQSTSDAGEQQKSSNEAFPGRRRREEVRVKTDRARINQGPSYPDTLVAEEVKNVDSRISELEDLKAELAQDAENIEDLEAKLARVEAELSLLEQRRKQMFLLLLMLE